MSGATRKGRAVSFPVILSARRKHVQAIALYRRIPQPGKLRWAQATRRYYAVAAVGPGPARSSTGTCADELLFPNLPRSEHNRLISKSSFRCRSRRRNARIWLRMTIVPATKGSLAIVKTGSDLRTQLYSCIIIFTPMASQAVR